MWALEELSVDYDIRKFPRPDGLAPPELKDTHPQGKSPQLILADGRVITQSTAILLYLFRTYDTAHRFHHPGVDDPVREDQLIGIGHTDLESRVVSTRLTFDALVIKSPFFVRPIMKAVRDTISRTVLDPEIVAILGVLESELDGREWFMGGDGPTRPDFSLRFAVDLVVKLRYNNLKDYPRLTAWFDRCEAREAWKRSLEKGNGYDLDFTSKW